MMLLRDGTQLPPHLLLATDHLGDGWSVVRSGTPAWMAKQVRATGWQCTQASGTTTGSGIGYGSKEAVANALILALRKGSASFNSAAVNDISIAKYPWFFVVRVSLRTYSIQRSPELPAPSADENAANAKQREEYG
jgi:hypothetical protein